MTREIDLTPEKITSQLNEAGIMPGSGWIGYEKAKRLLIGDKWIKEHQQIINTICEYLGL